ncbi:hypothetical protein D7U93_03355 [Stenotrophomonas maltophilia]|nr:hypothetical protein [Stenotrophomonas maltophilia]MBA0379579.1 hypothetical protein [Stenotrophomonas maltophilia]MBA0407109.1 hypothetical protein [Stenotrophomonas maltophilia]MBA0425763.1 hypothetical protein [Stenotrophomonas maltophilia]MBA0452302.1 hypothetical protein [Stenotrophomonas maltophilia]
MSAGLRPAPAVVPAAGRQPQQQQQQQQQHSVGWRGGVGVRGRREPIHGGLAAASIRLTPRPPTPPHL